MINEITFDDLVEFYKNKENLEIIDVREPGEYNEVHIGGAKLIPMGEVQERLGSINWDKKVIFYCRSGARSRMVASMMSDHGQDINNLSGGIMSCDNNWEGLEN